MTKSSLHPNPIQDASTGGAGIIAGELAAEEQSLLLHEEDSSSYGATEPVEDKEFAMPKRQAYVVLSSLFMASYLAALDTTVVTTLLTEIASDLNAVSQISWIATGYLLSCSAFQPLFGKLSDIFGRKPLLMLCTLCFGIGCLICSTDSLYLLVLGRFITGIGGGGLTSLGTITMSDIVPLRSRGLMQGLANVCFGLGAASGGVLGGVVSDLLGWKYVFLLQVPLAFLVGISIYFNLNLPEGSPGLGAHGSDIKSKLKRVDFIGSSLLVSSLIGMMLAASLGGRDIAYTLKTFIGLVIALLLLLSGFVYVELYISPEPVVPVELMADRTILSSSLTNWFFTMGVFSYMFYIPVFYTSVMGFTATQNGLRLVPNFFGVLLGSVGAGLYMKYTGRYYLLTVCAGIITVLGALNIFRISPQVSLFNQFTMVIAPGFGYSAILTITLLALIAAVPMKFQACTTSIQYTFRATGSTLGVSIATAIFQNILQLKLTGRVFEIIKDDPKKAQEIIESALESAEYMAHAPKFVQQAIKDSYFDGTKGALLFSLITIILGFISSLFMREHVLHTSMNRD